MPQMIFSIVNSMNDNIVNKVKDNFDEGSSDEYILRNFYVRSLLIALSVLSSYHAYYGNWTAFYMGIFTASFIYFKNYDIDNLSNNRDSSNEPGTLSDNTDDASSPPYETENEMSNVFADFRRKANMVIDFVGSNFGNSEILDKLRTAANVLIDKIESEADQPCDKELIKKYFYDFMDRIFE